MDRGPLPELAPVKGLEFPALRECIDELFVSAAACKRENAAVDEASGACCASRQAWSAYHHEWQVTPHRELKQVRERLRLGLEDCVLGIQTVRKNLQKNHDTDGVKLLGYYLENVEFRLVLLDLLHREGLDSVEAAMDDKQPTLVRS